MKPIVKLALIAGVTMLACISAKAQYKNGSDSGRMFYAGKGDFAINGNELSEGELFNLIGEKMFYETYQSAQKQRRLGMIIGYSGLGVFGAGAALATTYAIASKAHDPFDDDPFVAGEIIAGVGLAAAGVGFAYYFIGNGRLKWIAEDYNSRNDIASTLSFGPTRHGVGLTFNF